jgi:hypothetical protein
MNEPEPTWLPTAIIGIIAWLLSWGTWVTNKVMGGVSRREFETHREKRDGQMLLLIEQTATKDDIHELRNEIGGIRDLVIRGLQNQNGN